MEKQIASTIELQSLNGTAREVKALFRDLFADCEKRGFQSLTVRVEPNDDGDLKLNVYGFQIGSIIEGEDIGPVDPTD